MDKQLPKALIIVISVMQGIVLTLLYQSVNYKVWPATEPLWLTAFATLAISWPLLTLLTITTTNVKAISKYLLPFCLLLSVLGGYVGFQQEPIEYVTNRWGVWAFTFCALIASFQLLLYVQQLAKGEVVQGQTLSYSAMVKLSWQNFIILMECALFIGIFWGILHLGAGLFAVLEIDFFKELLKKSWFVIPVISVTFGCAIIVFRNILSTADNIATIVQTLIKFLLPALAIVSLGFLATLPFTGLAPLWKTGSGSLLILWLQALTLFFVNAVYQDGQQQVAYPKKLASLILVAVALLPVYSLIAGYGIWLRIAQYGLTEDRCWAILVWLLLAGFAFSYLFAIVKNRADSLPHLLNNNLAKVNIAMGGVLFGALLAVNSPLINFEAIAASSQIARLDSGKVSYDDFDYRYFKRSLARQGYLALQTLKKQLPPDHVKIIDRMYINPKQINKAQLSLADFDNYVTYWPSKSLFPVELIETVYQQESSGKRATYRDKGYYFVAQDLNSDGKAEFVVLTKSSNYSSAKFWQLKGKKWRAYYMTAKNLRDNELFLDTFFANSQIEAVAPKWQQLQIGDIVLTVK